MRELVKYLSELPPESEVAYIWDGCVRTGVRFLAMSPTQRRKIYASS